MNNFDNATTLRIEKRKEKRVDMHAGVPKLNLDMSIPKVSD